MGDAVWALLVGFFLASIVAFRRARGVLNPEVRREVARANMRVRTRVLVGTVALAAIVVVTRQLFR
jgi:hypothetical protein